MVSPDFNKRLAIENNSSDNDLINYGLSDNGYSTVKSINLALSTDNTAKVFKLGIRVYPLAHSNNLLGIDFRLTDPSGSYAIITAGSIGKLLIKWSDLACGVVFCYYPTEKGDYSKVLTDQLESVIRYLIPYVKQKKQAMPTSNKEKSSKSRNSRQLQKIIRPGIKR